MKKQGGARLKKIYTVYKRRTKIMADWNYVNCNWYWVINLSETCQKRNQLRVARRRILALCIGYLYHCTMQQRRQYKLQWKLYCPMKTTLNKIVYLLKTIVTALAWLKRDNYFKHFNGGKFLSDLNQLPWANVDLYSNPNDMERNVSWLRRQTRTTQIEEDSYQAISMDYQRIIV